MKTTTGVLLLQLGTPDAPTTGKVRTYLTEFLNDPRVIDINPAARALLVNGIIVPFRAPRSAKLYREIWTEDGSPLLIYARSVETKLQQMLGPDYHVVIGMRYRKPSIGDAVKELYKKKVGRILVLPLFPHNASSSTASAMEMAMKKIAALEIIPEVRMLNEYYVHPAFLNAWMERAKPYVAEKAYDHYLFTFHGVPWRHMRKTGCGTPCQAKASPCPPIGAQNFRCYRAQCHATAYALMDGLGLDRKKCSITFQSRLGRDPWLTPYTDESLKKLGERGIKHILVFSPSFVADCLETIHEVGVEYQELFEEHNGEKITLVPSLNDSAPWISALNTFIQELNS